MTKSELIEKIAAKNPHLMLKDVERIVAVIFDNIIAALAKGERVEFRGFGAFSVRNRSSRLAKTPEPVSRSKLKKEKSLTLKSVNNCLNS